MNTLYRIHSDVRWLILFIAAAAAVWFVLRLIRRDPYDRTSRFLMVLFGIVIDIQVLVGLIYFIWSGLDLDYWPRERFEHLVVMLVAAGIAHLPRRWDKSADVVRYRNNLFVVVAVVIIIVVGVLLLPSPPDRWDLGV